MMKTTWNEFLKTDELLRAMRVRMGKTLQRDARQLQAAALNPILEYLQQHPDATMQQVESMIIDAFQLPRLQADQLATDLQAAQTRIGQMRASMYADAGIDTIVSAERLQAAHSVNFRKIHSRTNTVIRNTLQRVLASDGAVVPTIYTALRQSNIVSSQAMTLANTALAMYDNDYTHQLAASAGVDVFEFTGPPAQRQFCIDHLGEQYTSEQIAGMNNGHGLPVRTSCGGYNCRHSWLAVPPFFQNKRNR